MPKFGAWSEYLAVNTNHIYKMPDNMTFKDAAALSYSYLTAYILLFEIGGVKSGQSVLFHSAGGGVGKWSSAPAALGLANGLSFKVSP